MIDKVNYDNSFQPKITKIDSTGIVTIDFGALLVVPKNYEFFNDNVILLKLIKEENSKTSESSSSSQSLLRNLDQVSSI